MSAFISYVRMMVVMVLMLCSFAGGSEDKGLYLAKIQLHTAEEIALFLDRVDQHRQAGDTYQLASPIAIVLHGDEAWAFLHENYSINQELVDLAAKLDAFHAVDIQVCETWMRLNGVTQDQLPRFVHTVPYGPLQEEKMLGSGYVYF